jgi:hypothetical protein
VIEIDRGDFLRLGAGGLLAGAIVPATAGAQLAKPAPQDDDIAFLSFATVAERASRDFYRAAAKAKGTGFTPGERSHLRRVIAAKSTHIVRLDGALGADAPLTEDFVTVLPEGAVKTKARSLALGGQLEALLVSVYLNGVSYAVDAGTRLLLGRLLVYDAQALTWLRLRGGKASPAGLASSIDLEAAAGKLHGFLSTPAFPD